MKKLFLLSAVPFLLVLSLVLTGASGREKPPMTDIYVSPAGNDRWSGLIPEAVKSRPDGPLATPEGARDLIRKMKAKGLKKGRVVVHFAPGTYFLQEPLGLTSDDSGKDSSECVIYEAGKNVRFSGGQYITNWTPVTDQEVVRQLSPEARTKTVMAILPGKGAGYYGSPEGGGAELFFNDSPMHISRYPNKGYIKITGLLNLDPVDVRGTKGDKTGRFFYDDDRVSSWKSEKDGWVHGYWFWDWSEQRHRIASIDDDRKILEVAPPYHNYGYRTGQWFYGFNLLSEIDEPGEYYIDRQEGIIYFYPPADITKGTAYLSAGTGIVRMVGVSNLSFRGMVMEGCRGTAVIMKNCENVSVRGCAVRNCGESAIEITGSVNCGAEACDIYNAGAGGIRIEAGDRKTLTPGNCYADNNYIHDIARLRRVYFPGVSISGVANRITHNLITMVPHMAIGFLGNDNLIEYNEIDSACYESNDAGAIYTGRNWTMRGNVIRYNYLHNISGFEGKGCVGIYLDDAFSSAEISGNVFRKVSRAMMIGGGRDNKVLNNIFVECTPSVHVDARGLGWMKNEHIPGWLESARDSGLIQGIAYRKPPYSTRYPELVNITDDEPRAPRGNVISRNVCLGGVWDKAAGFWHMAIEDKARPYLKMEANVVSPGSLVEDPSSPGIILADPLFENKSDPEAGMYRLRSDSPALKNGFSQIPFERIGLYLSKDRSVVPAGL
jgi:hypothetical protein